MEHILICSTPAVGHVNLMLAVASGLKSRGYKVTFNTSEIFRLQVESAGIPFIPLRGTANFDHRQIDEIWPQRKTLQAGPEMLMHDFKHIFGDVIPDQYEGILRIMEREQVDLIMADVTFMGTFPLLLGARESRPPIVGGGIIPLLLSSQDISPFTGPSSDPASRVQNKLDNTQFAQSLNSVDIHINRILRRFGAEPLPGFILDSLYTLPDVFLQFSAQAFEFPRSDKPDSLHLVGPVLPEPSNRAWPPEWWGSIDFSRPVVLVTQGTVANKDFSELVEPTMAGLAEEDLTVIVSTAGADPDGVAAIAPRNAYVTQFIPFDKVLPHVDVFVTNGGYGAVTQALHAGKPVVAAGATEDKPFVAARVAWTGAGIDLKTGRPSPEQVWTAVRSAIDNPSYRQNAQRLRRELAKYSSPDEVAKHIGKLLQSGMRIESLSVAQ